MEPNILHTDPVAQELLSAPMPARLAYTALDGTPRAVPVGFLWVPEPGSLVICTDPATPKVAALRARPEVALTVDTDGFPPKVLLVRGTATMEVVDGVPDEYLAASRKVVRPEQWAEFEAGVRATYESMVRITVVPAWVKVMDFTEPGRAPEFLGRRTAA